MSRVSRVVPARPPAVPRRFSVPLRAWSEKREPSATAVAGALERPCRSARGVKLRSGSADAHEMGKKRTNDLPDKRRFERYACRIPCEVRTPQGAHRAIVTDLSATGLFVQLRNSLPAGTEVGLVLLHGNERIEARGVVMRGDSSHRSIECVKQPGVGLEIKVAPEAYYQIVMGLHQG